MKQLNSFQFTCKFKECDAVLSFKEAKDHIKTCKFYVCEYECGIDISPYAEPEENHFYHYCVKLLKIRLNEQKEKLA